MHVPIATREIYDQSTACQRGRLKGKELEQYFRAMITEREEKGIAAFYKEEGLREGFDLGKAEGIAEGMAAGMAEGRTEVAKAMLKDGLKTEKVMAYTGLSKKEIEALK